MLNLSIDTSDYLSENEAFLENKISEMIHYTFSHEDLTKRPYFADIRFVSNEEIQAINRDYRNIDKITDVISFALEDETSDFVVEIEDMPVNLGEIIISVDRAKEQAVEYKHSFEREICFLAVHGFLHLLGYDHMNAEDEEVMFTKQENILKQFAL